MPMYEFECKDCDSIFVQKRPFAEAHKTADCPECSGANTRKRLTAVAFISSGPGTIPVPMSNGGGCGCGGACACQN
jgi:putative FmdB family regulatory protein